MTDVRIRRALLSVSDKTGLAELGAALGRLGVELVSTGGTAKALREAGLEVRDVADLTGSPEMMDGRVKTLHPAVHGALLGVRGDAVHEAAMAEHGIAPIDLLVVNLYPFAQTVARGAGRDEVIENIDIGGPAMIRSAAKNHSRVTVATDPADYPTLVEELDAKGGALGEPLRRSLAKRAFAHTAAYDSAIASWFAFADAGERFPETLPLALSRAQGLRYGENPHQQAALYLPQVVGAAGIAQARQVQGKELSYNNLNDADAALELVGEFGTRPCLRDREARQSVRRRARGSIAQAYERALRATRSRIRRDRRGQPAARRRGREAITRIFTEVVIAPMPTRRRGRCSRPRRTCGCC
jgi:phosphoribosylaminoimidazolecarboxamide formyltransferase/IMP cyclohydrolase